MWTSEVLYSDEATNHVLVFLLCHHLPAWWFRSSIWFVQKKHWRLNKSKAVSFPSPEGKIHFIEFITFRVLYWKNTKANLIFPDFMFFQVCFWITNLWYSTLGLWLNIFPGLEGSSRIFLFKMKATQS